MAEAASLPALPLSARQRPDPLRLQLLQRQAAAATQRRRRAKRTITPPLLLLWGMTWSRCQCSQTRQRAMEGEVPLQPPPPQRLARLGGAGEVAPVPEEPTPAHLPPLQQHRRRRRSRRRGASQRGAGQEAARGAGGQGRLPMRPELTQRLWTRPQQAAMLRMTRGQRWPMTPPLMPGRRRVQPVGGQRRPVEQRGVAEGGSGCDGTDRPSSSLLAVMGVCRLRRHCFK